MEKVRREKIRDGEDQTGRKSEERGCRCEKVGKSRSGVFSNVLCSGGSKSRLRKAASAEPASSCDRAHHPEPVSLTMI